MSKTEESLTRVYTINLGRAWLTPQYRRTDRVVNMIREFAQKHMQSDEVKLDQDLNRQIWLRGKTNPPRKVRVKMVKDEDGIVTVSSYEELKTESEIPTPPNAKLEDEEKPIVEVNKKELKEKTNDNHQGTKKIEEEIKESKTTPEDTTKQEKTK